MGRRCVSSARTALEPVKQRTHRRSSQVGARLIYVTLLCCTFIFTPVGAQQPDDSDNKPVLAQALEGNPEPPDKVEVQPVAADGDIQQRLANILNTTGWFGEPQVTVEAGIVYVKGTTENEEARQWAGELAKNTEGVIAVVNQIEVDPSTVWDFAPTFQVLEDLVRRFIRLLPLILVALAIIAVSWIFARLMVSLLRRRLLARSGSQLLREVMAGIAGWSVPCAADCRAHATRAHIGRRHRPGWSGAGHRVPRHHREFFSPVCF